MLEYQGQPSEAQLFAVGGQVQVLPNGNRLCGIDLVDFMTVREVEGIGSGFIEVAFYGGPKEAGTAEGNGATRD